MTPDQRPPSAPAPPGPEPFRTWAKTQLAALAERLPDWEPWYVETPFDPASRYLWCARPEGAALATCKGSDPAELITAVAEYEATLPERILSARDELRRTPAGPATAGRHNVLARQLAALTRLHARRQAEARPPAAGEQQPPAAAITPVTEVPR